MTKKERATLQHYKMNPHLYAVSDLAYREYQKLLDKERAELRKKFLKTEGFHGL